MGMKEVAVILCTVLVTGLCGSQAGKWYEAERCMKFSDDGKPGYTFANHRVPPVCLSCLCKRSGCAEMYGKCNNSKGWTECGPYRITKPFFVDCGGGTMDLAYKACTQSLACSERCVHNYMARYARSCDKDRNITCEDYVRYHLGGPSGCTNTLDDYNNQFVQDVLQCVADGGPEMPESNETTTASPVTEPPTTPSACPELTQPANGKVSVECLDVGCVAKFNCQKCFKFGSSNGGKPKRKLKCTKKGWSDPPPICQNSECASIFPRRESHADIVSLNGNVVSDNKVDGAVCGDVVRFACPLGFHVAENDVNRRTCDKKGKWNPNGIPSCEQDGIVN